MDKGITPGIVVDEEIRFGKPVIKGTRVPVDLILGKLAGGMAIEEVIEDAKTIFFALPAPPSEDGSAGLSYVKQAASNVADLLADEDLPGPKRRIVANKSTVLVGTGDQVQEVFEKRGLEHGTGVAVVSNPEFLREGAAVEDFMKPDRVVIGTEVEWAAERMETLYEPFVRQGNRSWSWTAARRR